MIRKKLYNILFGTLRRQIIVGVAVVQAIIMTLFIFTLTWRQQVLILDRQTEHATALAQTLATSAAGWIAAGDISGLQELVEAKRRYPDLVYAMLLNNQGQVLAHTDRSRLGLYVRDLPGDIRDTSLSRRAAQVDVIVPATLADRHVGWACVGVGQRLAGQKLAENTRNGVLYALIAILMGSFLALLSGKRITRRLYEIQSVMDEVRSGNHQARSNITGTDEAAGMANNFNMMLDKLEQREKEVRQSEERLNFTLTTSHTGGWDLDLVDHTVFRTLEHDRIFGYGSLLPQWTYEMFLEHVLPEDRAEMDRCFREATATKTEWNYECRIRRVDGEVRWIWVAGEHQRDEAGYTRRMAGIVQDITDRKRAEEALAQSLDQLRQSQKIEAVGRLAGGVAHDFNNLLTVIIGYCELMMLKIEEGNPLLQDLQEIRKSADRAAALTRQLLAFSRRQILMPKVLEIDTMIPEMVNMLRRLIGEDVDLVTILGAGAGKVKFDPGQIEQAIVNLVVNSRDAMPGGGTITIETASVELDEAYVRTHGGVGPGPHVMLSVSDTGCGMAPETLSKAFDPFFTTKEKGKGTGLGLSTVFGIVKQSGGCLYAYSEPGRGTTMKIYLPRVTGETAPKDERRDAGFDDRLQGSETILLVEDEETLRKLAVAILEGYGYTVLVAGNGEEALQLLNNSPAIPRLLVTDVVMPKMGGRELSDRIKAIHPGTRVLFMSGYTDNAIVHHGVLDLGVSYLQKPFTPKALARKVREVLDKA